MKKILCFLACMVCYASFSQVTFEKGFFIDNDGNRKEVLIRNSDNRSNPAEFEYKISENSEIKVLGVNDVQEFGIDDYGIFRSRTVAIDRSSARLGDLRKDSAPEMENENLFLKLLIEGDASLYNYKDGALERFFYEKNDKNIEQLVWKKFLNAKNKIDENNYFKQQLWNNLNCGNIERVALQRLEYRESDLVAFFEDYNKCKDVDFTNYKQEKKKLDFNITIRPRYNNSSLTVANPGSEVEDSEFDNESGFGVGLEAEVILPFNKNKWSVFIEPTYQSYKSEINRESDNISDGDIDAEIAYSSIELPIGVRHYFFLNQDSKLFANAAYVLDFSSESELIYKRSFSGTVSNRLDVNSRSNFAFGLGFKQNDRYSLELRYQTSRELLSDYVQWKSDYQTISVILGYSFF